MLVRSVHPESTASFVVGLEGRIARCLSIALAILVLTLSRAMSLLAALKDSSSEAARALAWAASLDALRADSSAAAARDSDACSDASWVASAASAAASAAVSSRSRAADACGGMSTHIAKCQRLLNVTVHGK